MSTNFIEDIKNGTSGRTITKDEYDNVMKVSKEGQRQARTVKEAEESGIDGDALTKMENKLQKNIQ